MIKLNINVNKLDKTKFFKGEKGTYADLILIETPGGQYGDYMVKQDQSKEDRQAGNEMPILGNGKNVIKGQSMKGSGANKQVDDDEIPF